MANGSTKGCLHGIAAACQVLNTLINFKSHSWPFLKPVTKKEAKDYDMIVKKPMAFSIMTDKVGSTAVQRCKQYGILLTSNSKRGQSIAMDPSSITSCTIASKSLWTICTLSSATASCTMAPTFPTSTFGTCRASDVEAVNLASHRALICRLWRALAPGTRRP